MQTLWSRVAQVQSACRCPQCAPAVQGVGRRAAASATRRIPRYFTTSTLWYSGIFAAAATIDAGAKQQRREKWDKAIAEAKQELAQPGVVRPKTEYDVHAEGEMHEEPVRFVPFGEEEGQDEFQYTDGETRAHWPANTGAPLTRFLAPNSVYGGDKQKAMADMARYGPKKLAKVQTSMDILLLRLMRDLAAQDPQWTSWIPMDLQSRHFQDQAGVEELLAIKMDYFAMLRRCDSDLTHFTTAEAPDEPMGVPADKYPMCHYGQDDDNRFRRVQRDLNLSLQRLFKLRLDERISRPSMIGRIIHHLRQSSAPPSTDTFNILLLGFSKIGDAESFYNARASFLNCSMRPNETTLATVLNHFTKVGDPAAFTRWIERIRGGRGGLALARPDIEIKKESKGRLMRHPDDPSKVIQLPHHSPLVFGAMIAGVLKFAGLESALEICRGMGKEGWGLCMAGLTPLLHDCVRRQDWKAGVTVWKQILELKEQSRRKEDSRWLTERIQLSTFAAMLRLCLKCGRRDEFDEVWGLALRSHQGRTERLRTLIKGTAAREGFEVVEGTIKKAIHSEQELNTSGTPRAYREWETRLMEEEMAAIKQAQRMQEEQGGRHVDASSDRSTITLHLEPFIRSDHVDNASAEAETDENIPTLLERLVLPNENVLADLTQGNTFPRQQSLEHFQLPNRSFEDSFAWRLSLRDTDVLAQPENEGVVLRQATEHLHPRHPELLLSDRLVLRNDEVLASTTSTEASLRHASTMTFGERALAVQRPDLPGSGEGDFSLAAGNQSGMRSVMDYLEFAEQDDPKDAAVSRSQAQTDEPSVAASPDPSPDASPTVERSRPWRARYVAAPEGWRPWRAKYVTEPERKWTRGLRIHKHVAVDTTLPDSGVMMKKLRLPREAPEQVREEQLHGLLPSSAELEEYEIGERPMTLRA